MAESMMDTVRHDGEEVAITAAGLVRRLCSYLE